MRARVVAGRGRRGEPWKRFRPGRWYPAEWAASPGGDIRLVDRSVAAVWPSHQVEVRNAADDEWELRATSRMSQSVDGQTIEYPARVAECPEGHMRAIPTRFDSHAVDLRCADCRRRYRLTTTA